MSYNRAKPLGSGMLKKDFKGENSGGVESQLTNWEVTMNNRYNRALGRARVRLKQIELKRQRHDRNRIQGDANGAS